MTGSEWIRLCVFGGVVGCGRGVLCECARGVCERRLTDAFFHSGGGGACACIGERSLVGVRARAFRVSTRSHECLNASESHHAGSLSLSADRLIAYCRVYNIEYRERCTTLL